MGQGQTQERRPRTGVLVTADDGTQVIIRRDDSIKVLGLTPRLRVYRVVDPTGKREWSPMGRSLVKLLIKGRARVTGRVT